MQITPLTPLHDGASGTLSEALRRLPQYLPLTQALDRCAQAIAERRGTLNVPATASLVDDVLHRLAAGDPVPNTLDDAAYDASKAAAQTQAGLDVLLAVEGRLASERDEVVLNGADDLARDLDARVKAVVSEARALDLQGAVDADEALERGVGEAWTALTKLCSRYFQLREAQRQAMAYLSRDEQHVDGFGFLENYAELYPRWYDAGRPQPQRSLIDGARVVAAPSSEAAPWPDSPAGRFLWLVTHPEAEPWVPTARQLEQAVTAAVEARNVEREASREPVNPEAVRRQDELIARYRQRLAAEQDRAHAYGGA